MRQSKEKELQSFKEAKEEELTVMKRRLLTTIFLMGCLIATLMMIVVSIKLAYSNQSTSTPIPQESSSPPSSTELDNEK